MNAGLCKGRVAPADRLRASLQRAAAELGLEIPPEAVEKCRADECGHRYPCMSLECAAERMPWLSHEEVEAHVAWKRKVHAKPWWRRLLARVTRRNAKEKGCD